MTSQLLFTALVALVGVERLAELVSVETACGVGLFASGC